MPAAQNLARELADLKRRLSALERSSQLSSSSIEDSDGGTLDVLPALAAGTVAQVVAAGAAATANDIRSSGAITVQSGNQGYDLQRTVAALTQFTGTMQAFYGVNTWPVTSTSYDAVLVDQGSASPRAFDRALEIKPITTDETFGDDTLIMGLKSWIKVTANLNIIADATAPGGRIYVRMLDRLGLPIRTFGMRLPANGMATLPCVWVFEWTYPSDAVTGGLSIEARLQSTTGGSYTIDGTNSMITVESTVRDWSTVRV